MIEQKAELSRRIRRLQCLEDGEVFKIERNNVRKAVKVLLLHLARPIPADINPMPAGHSLGPPIWRFTHMPTASTGRANLPNHADAAYLPQKRGLGERRPANVAKADQEDREFSGHVVPD